METSKQPHLCDMHRSRRRRRFLVTAALLAVLAGFCALTLYVVYRPMKPQASVLRAAVFQLANAAGNNHTASSPPYALAACVQFTLLLHNPSDRAALLYDGLLAYVAYRGEPVTPPEMLPSLVQERGADVALSPLLGGGGVAVPVSADAVGALAADCAARRVQLRLVVMGRVRYRTGPFRSWWRDLYVRCDVTLGIDVPVPAGSAGIGNVPLLEYPECFVDA
ncbi:hypothetical protein QOZ80_6BG0482430 [Eleusine coracana subsp. coracana]|nr:hypothetical protein QOZ80_6BG0482430 [Eleusine coracana subsp. coracana]